ncbi:MAG: NAD(P)(+) transhydrogenase (Re/Si-specific) subunit beta [Planctomycetales bacterium]|nr:NAD(P)(+) transhydrogenase (Re/Si-specific) subunit beta [Planctomycetales bacterium]
MTTELEIGLYIFMLAGFLGYHLISRVPPLLHTPLMSATNAMSGISLVGSLLVAGSAHGTLHTLFGFIAVTCSATNVVGGFLITDRMLKMFRRGAGIPVSPAGDGGAGGAARPSPLRASVGPALFLILVASLFGFDGLRGFLRAWGIDPGQTLSVLYVASAILFILGLKGLSSPKWARKGMWMAMLGMLVAVVGTLFHHGIVQYSWITLGLLLGSVIGGSLGYWIPMTAVPQRTAFSHSLGALAATLIGISEYVRHGGMLALDFDRVKMTTIGFEVVIGALTFTGSLMAAGKLMGLLPGAPMTYRGQNASNIALFATMVGSLVAMVVDPSMGWLFFTMVGVSLLFGFLLVIPIGAADMPVVISLLNSYAGLADAAMGFVLMNKIQIITGSLDGTSGLLLSILMCRAMNRSALNVLFGAFGKIEAEAPRPESEADAKGTVRSIQPEEVPVLFDDARSVIIVPGYGMAVAQAQHAVSDLAKALGKRGIDVKYAIHPVAGRMPGHMNVLLAEADVPYDRLYEMEQINPYFAEADVALVVGANDVTNPAARTNRASPLYGMPILEVDRAKSVIVLKRSMRPGFAGVDNELYYNPKCMMLFGDAKESLTKLFAVLK